MNTEKKLYTLEGKLLSPIISTKSIYKKKGCWIRMVGELATNKKLKRSFVGKLVKGERKAPTILYAYRGFVRVSYVTSSETQAQKRINYLLALDNLGNNTNDGFGKIKWLNYRSGPLPKTTSTSKVEETANKKGIRIKLS
ncbi:MAG: hypothetical protein HZR80_02745 [Candidatus Heimdallarchaeota archaeon]